MHTLLALTLLASPSGALERAHRAASELRTLTADDRDAAFTPQGSEAFDRLRHALRDLGAEALGDGRTDLANARLALESDVSMLLGEGGFVEVRADEVPGHAELRAVDVGLTAGAHSDDAVYLYERRGVAWHEVLASESPAHGDAHDARESQLLRVSPSDARGNWFAAVAWGVPWETSCWNEVHLEVMRPSADPEAPIVIDHRSAGDYRCDEEVYRLAVSRSGIAFAYIGHDDLDPVSLSRVHVETFRVAGDKLLPEPPEAVDAEGLVDAWAGADWSLAKEVVAPGARRELLEAHRALAQAREDGGSTEAVRHACEGDRELIEVSQSGDDDSDRSFLFLVGRTPHGLQLLAAPERAPDDCDAEELPPSPQVLPALSPPE
ncbi:MAG: hypothetical protein JST54_19530 [Deltaproteobacteria bacterium]|nr:hypothetical protein [Deltaproteobacteria bacterium]